MKKLGFTMPELIITLAIVGVAAAVAAPVIGNLMPDKNKLKAIECYNLVNAATEEFLSDEGIYFAPDEWTCHSQTENGDLGEELPRAEHIHEPDGYPDCEALMCWDHPPDRVPYVNENLTSRKKYRGLLFIKYGIEPLSFDGDGLPDYREGVSSDRTQWTMSALVIRDADGNRPSSLRNAILYGYRIEFDVNPNNNNDENASCFYNADTCKNPDKFRIYVNHEGNIFAGDPMMEAYLLNPLNMNKKKEDREKAQELANSGKDYENPRFLYTASNN